MVRLRTSLGLMIAIVSTAATSEAAVPVAQTFADPSADDQDDMAIWLHPTDPSLSTIIASDKGGGLIVVYGLDGATLQTIETPQPGNIDLRRGVTLGTTCVDVVGFNERVEDVVKLFRVDHETRELVAIDTRDADVGPNYGFALHVDDEGRLFAYTGPEGTTNVQQFEVQGDAAGSVSLLPTGWEFEQSQIEGMVADDEAGYIFLGEEANGIWKVNVEDASDATLIAEDGDASGLAADIEGLTLYRTADGGGYLIASSQGADKFTVFDRAPPHAPLGEFTIEGVGSTDGIDVLNVALDATFDQGIFTFHNGAACCPVQAARWQDVVAEVPTLSVDTVPVETPACRDDPGGDESSSSGTSGGTADESSSDGSGNATGTAAGESANEGGPSGDGTDTTEPSSSEGTAGGSEESGGCGCTSRSTGEPRWSLVIVLGLLALTHNPRRRSPRFTSGRGAPATFARAFLPGSPAQIPGRTASP